MAPVRFDAGRCPYCGQDMRRHANYVCPRCGRHNDLLYRIEHADPQRAWSLTAAQIRAEYRAAGMGIPG